MKRKEKKNQAKLKINSRDQKYNITTNLLTMENVVSRKKIPSSFKLDTEACYHLSE